MSKFSSTTVLDALLTEVAKAVNITVCSSQPTAYSGIAGVTLAAGTKTAGIGGADYSVAGASGSARTLTVSQSNSLSVTTSGTATHIALDDGTNLLEVTTVATSGGQPLTSGGTVSIPAWTVAADQPT